MMPLWLLACTGSEPTDAPEAAPEPAPRPPDVVLIVVDTLRHDALGFMGAVRPTSPRLDAFAAESAWFSRAYAASTWTLPSMATILTGLGPWEHRVVHSAQQREDYGQLSAEIPSLATTMKARGYRTAAFINNAFLAPAFGLNQGFDVYDYEGAGLVDHRTAAATTDAALAWLDGSDEPAFLLVHMMEPHADYQPAGFAKGRFTEGMPHTREVPLGDAIVDAMIVSRITPPEPDQAYLHASYHEEVLTIDTAVGDLLDGLKARPGWDEARVAFTSDHGEEFWDYGQYEHGHTTFSVVTGVPLVLKGPDTKPGPNRSVVSLLDLHDWLADGAGDLGRLAGGVEEMGRIAVMEDTLYTEQQASAVSDTRRYVSWLETKNEAFFALEDDGDEVVKLSDLDAAEVKRLRDELVRVRGTEPTPVAEALAVPDAQTFDQLRALGYLE